MDLTGRLFPPKKLGEVPPKAEWLSGEGGGAWFFIQKENEYYRIQRFTPQGIKDCNRLFQLKSNSVFDTEAPFKMQHISHCAIVRVVQNNIYFEFYYSEG